MFTNELSDWYHIRVSLTLITLLLRNIPVGSSPTLHVHDSDSFISVTHCRHEDIGLSDSDESEREARRRKNSRDSDWRTLHNSSELKMVQYLFAAPFLKMRSVYGESFLGCSYGACTLSESSTGSMCGC